MDDHVYVKLSEIREGGKLSLTMRNINQENGAEVGRMSLSKVKRDQVKYDDQGRKIGALTGILLEESTFKMSKKDGLQALKPRGPRLKSPDMWEMKQLKGGQALHLVQDLDPNFNQMVKDAEGDPDNLNEEYTELELNEDQAPFLRGQQSA